jgi:hypothetical protein
MLNVAILILPGIKILLYPGMFERGKFNDVLTIIIYHGKGETGRVLQNNKYLNRQGIFIAHALLALFL